MGAEKELFDAWLDGVADTPFYGAWSGILTLVAACAAIVAIVTLLLLLVDLGSLVVLHTRRYKDESSVPGIPRLRFGLVGTWLRTLYARADRGHGAGVAEIEALAVERFHWSGTLLNTLQSIALMTGLLFTFLGLGISLDKLASALNLSSGADGGDIVVTLRNVRDALPGLGTAFASSVCGVFLALIIGSVSGILDAMGSRLTAGLSALSAMWLEPMILPATGEGAVLRVGQQVERTGQRLADLGERQAQQIEMLGALADQLMTLPGSTVEAWSEVGEHLRGVMDQAQSGFVTHEGNLQVLLTTMHETATLVSDRMSGAAHDLEVSGEHVRGLRAAAESFEKALGVNTEIAHRLEASQLRILEQVKETFETIPRMTEAVTTAASNTAGAADRFALVLGNDEMRRYLERLPELADLVEAEKESRAELSAAARRLGGLSESAYALEQSSQRMMGTAENVQLAYQEMAAGLAELTTSKMLPVLESLVRRTAGEVVASELVALDGFAQRHDASLKQLNAVLLRLEKTTRDVVETQGRLEQHLRLPIVSRFFRGG